MYMWWSESICHYGAPLSLVSEIMLSLFTFWLLCIAHPILTDYVLTCIFFLSSPPAPPISCVCIWSLHLIKGGSWISTGAESSRFARFAFRRHFIQHEGFRLVRSANPTPVRLCDAEVFVLGAGVSGKIIVIRDQIILYNIIMKYIATSVM